MIGTPMRVNRIHQSMPAAAKDVDEHQAWVFAG